MCDNTARVLRLGLAAATVLAAGVGAAMVAMAVAVRPPGYERGFGLSVACFAVAAACGFGAVKCRGEPPAE